MKKITFLFLVLILPIFTSCGGKTNPSSQDNHICSFSNMWSKNDSKHWKECSCGKRSEEANHSFSEWQEIEQATTSKEGLKEQTCSICNYKKQEKINKLEPLYSWKSVDLLQPTIIVGGHSSVVYDENGKKQKYTDLVDRQLDMLSQEIVSRLEYVYGDTNKNETHNIIDNLNNTTFTTYNSMNAFSESLSKSTRYPVYDSKGNGAGNGYIMMTNGEKVVYDSTLHSHYITLNGTKYAAVCSANVAGIFTSETALQSTFEGLGKPTISHAQNSYDHEGILTFQNAIYGTPTWEYEEKQTSIETNYNFIYNTAHEIPQWNWAEDFKNESAVNKLKIYLAYIIANNITNYNNLPNENSIITNESDYQTLLSKITYIDNYINDKILPLLQEVIVNRIIGTNAYGNDLQAGSIGNQIAHAILTTALKLDLTESEKYYDNGLYVHLYSNSITNFNLYFINNYSNKNLSIKDFLSARNYKGYDIIVNGILRQISNQTAYKSLSPESYQSVDFASSQFITTETDESHIYLFLKTKTSNDIRFVLGVPYDTNVTLKDKNGNVINFTKENVDGKLGLRLKSSDLPSVCTVPNDLSHIQGYGASSSLDELLKDLDYLELIISGVSSFSLGTEEYVQTN